CLFHLSELSFDPDLFEVLVIDNGSTDDTKDVSLSFQGKIKNLRYLFCESPGLMAARHMGCDEAKGEILCYIDDDSLLTKDWLKGISESFADKDVAMVGGPCIPEYEIEPPYWVEYFWSETEYGKINTVLSLVDLGNQKLFINPVFVFGCNYSIRKKIFLEFGGTNPDYFPEKYRQFQGDGESGLAAKISCSGYKTVYDPLVKIRHLIPQSRLTVEYFCWRRYFNGIHGSYSALRRQYGVNNANDKKKMSIVRRVYRRIKRVMTASLDQNQQKNNDEPEEIRQIRGKMQKSYEAGYRYHQEEVKRDPKLLEWVLRENYLGEDGKLP
ncbi:MAG: glycosyltransferase, partial [Bacteroidota bacterium]|nr:glycosyltransferase [Bacteroidota bacterium]